MLGSIRSRQCSYFFSFYLRYSRIFRYPLGNLMSKSYNKRITMQGVTYDSKFEHRILQETNLQQSDYHSCIVPYEIHSTHKYHPDFTIVNHEPQEGYYDAVHFEAKGRFNFKHDLNKYKHIDKCLKDNNQKLVFIFENLNTRIPGAKVRKDGSYLTNCQWADKIDIKWVAVTGVNKLLGEIRHEDGSR